MAGALVGCRALLYILGSRISWEIERREIMIAERELVRRRNILLTVSQHCTRVVSEMLRDLLADLGPVITARN